MLKPTEKPIAMQGVEGSYSSLAVNAVFPDQEKLCFESFREVIDAVADGRADYGVLPAENSSTGSILEVYDLLREGRVLIAAEKTVKVEHCLFGLPGAVPEKLREIHSHPQAFLQCSEFLKQLPDVQLKPYFNTAISAKRLTELGDPSIGVIAGAYAGRLYGLQPLASQIQDNFNNYTRFFILSRTPYEGTDASRVSVVFSVPNRSGALYDALRAFAENRLNLVKLESRPYPQSRFSYFFLAEFEGNLKREDNVGVLRRIEAETSEFLYLGNFAVL